MRLHLPLSVPTDRAAVSTISTPEMRDLAPGPGQLASVSAASATESLPRDARVIVIEHLYEAFQSAVKKFLVAAEMDRAVKKRVSRHLPTLLCIWLFGKWSLRCVRTNRFRGQRRFAFASYESTRFH